MHMRVHTGKHTHTPHPPAPPLPLLCRLFTFSRLHNKGLTPADIGVMATHVVLSALAIMPYDQVGVEKVETAEVKHTRNEMLDFCTPLLAFFCQPSCPATWFAGWGCVGWACLCVSCIC